MLALAHSVADQGVWPGEEARYAVCGWLANFPRGRTLDCPPACPPVTAEGALKVAA
jgi:hypothetical protein